MSSLRRFAKLVVEGDLANVLVYRRADSEVNVVGNGDSWSGSVGTWQEALTVALQEAQAFDELADRAIHPDELAFARAGQTGGMTAAVAESKRWLSTCHAMLDDAGIPSGSIVDRVKASIERHTNFSSSE